MNVKHIMLLVGSLFLSLSIFSATPTIRPATFTHRLAQTIQKNDLDETLRVLEELRKSDIAPENVGIFYKFAIDEIKKLLASPQLYKASFAIQDWTTLSSALEYAIEKKEYFSEKYFRAKIARIMELFLRRAKQHDIEQPDYFSDTALSEQEMPITQEDKKPLFLEIEDED
jgi:hypothetical protein